MTKFPTCNLIHHPSNRGCCNKFMHEDRAVTRISPVPHPPEEEEFNTNKPSSPARNVLFLGLLLNLSSKKYQYIHVIPVNRQVIVNFPSPCVFSRIGFLRINTVSPFIVCVVFVILHLHFKYILSFVVWIDHLITHNGKSLPQFVT